VYVTTYLNQKDLSTSLLDKLQKRFPKAAILSKTFWSQKIDRHMKHELARLSIMAIALIFTVLFLFLGLKIFRLYIAVTAPLISAISAIFIFSKLSNISLNSVHIIMSIIVCGLSIDYGVFLATQKKEMFLKASTISVFICALTTLAGFGVLALARHPVLASMGQVTFTGIAAALITALTITPTIIAKDK